MAYELNGTSQYFNTTSAPVTAAPLTLAAWFYPNNATSNMVLVSIPDNAEVNSNRFFLYANGVAAGDPIETGAQGTGGLAIAATTTGFSANSWNHACGVFASTSSRTSYLNGGSAGTNTATVTPSGVDRVRMAARFNGGNPGLYLSGRLAEIGIWSAALNADEVASLADGITCDKVRPRSLVFYAPLVRNLVDVKGGLTITNNNTATVANHPRVYA
ncbi:MAG: LamG domain-containing protein [Caulobacteraceae bacterium]|nr:LamG domain-containing protein [Caulobacteraceae bacterium]